MSLTMCDAAIVNVSPFWLVTGHTVNCRQRTALIDQRLAVCVCLGHQRDVVLDGVGAPKIRVHTFRFCFDICRTEILSSTGFGLRTDPVPPLHG